LPDLAESSMPPSNQPWSLKVESAGNQTNIRLEGDNIYFDEETTAAVRQQLFALLESLPPGDMFLDFANVSFLTSNTLAMLLSLRKKWESLGGQLFLKGLNSEVFEVFRITRLDNVFDFR
jgi:anti-anti-sigma factor